MAAEYGRKLSGGQMPAAYHQDDALWIDGKLSMFGVEERGKLCVAYAKRYKETHDTEHNEIRKDGIARRDANTRLREYVSKRFIKRMGC